MLMFYHNCRCQSTQKLFDKDFLEKNLKIKELTISVGQLEKVIEQKNVEIGETLTLLDQVQTECKKASEQVMLELQWGFKYSNNLKPDIQILDSSEYWTLSR